MNSHNADARSRSTSRRNFLSGAGVAIGSAVLSMDSLSLVEGKEREKPNRPFDYIVVGAGSAGCVVAARLSEEADANVLLLEAGGIDDKPEIHDPRKWAALLNSEVDWKYSTEEEEFLNKRRIPWPQGKVLGGSSAINAMIYIRGHRSTFDRWNALGNVGWDYDSVLPYFKKSEDNSRGPSQFHGVGGPLSVMDHPAPCEFVQAMIESAKGNGFRGDERWDFNGVQQEDAAGSYQFTIKNGKRHSTAVAFLRSAMSRSNLTVQANSLVSQLLFKGNRVTGVEVITGGKTRTVSATREVILCAGAINSPKVLMLSGIGPANHLTKHKIAVRTSLPGVGENLHDHPNTLVAHHSKVDTPPDHISAVDGGLFVRSRIAQPHRTPDIQFMGLQLDGRRIDASLGDDPLWSLVVTLTQPKSRGSIRLRSSSPTDRPLIRANYLADQDDRTALLFGIDLARRLARQASLQAISDGEVFPGADVRTGSDLSKYLSRMVSTTYHPVGTCKMGRDEMAVVDWELRVHGVEGLRVADASIMPVITNGNTNAPTIMIAEKAADMIKKANG